jgi:hypothetical protein
MLPSSKKEEQKALPPRGLAVAREALPIRRTLGERAAVTQHTTACVVYKSLM